MSGSSTDGPSANGKAFLGIIRQVKTAHGADVLRRAVRASGQATTQVFAESIRSLGWYPYPSFAGFLAGLDSVLGNGDGSSCRELGSVAGTRDLQTVFKLLLRLQSPERLIRSCDRVWDSYYRNAGRMEAVRWQPDDTVIRIYDFPGMHPAHCRLMEGWMIQTMTTIGCEVHDSARESECTNKGGRYHEFVCTWAPR